MSGPDHLSRASQFHARYDEADVELPYAGIDTFLKAETGSIEDVTDADVAILGAPYDGAVSNRPGARYGPRAVRRASGWLAYLSGYKGGLTNIRTGKQVNFDAFDIVDCGDIPIFPMDRERTAEAITAYIATVAEQDTMPVLVGGDHYCTFPAFKGFAEGSEYDHIGLVQIDAHTDTVRESAVFGTHFHGSSTHHIADSPHTTFADVAQIGIRGYESPEFFEFADEEEIGLFTMSDIEDRGIRPVIQDAIEHATAETEAAYVTIDIDAVDPAKAPGTGTPEPGGLSAAQALTIIEQIGTHDAFVAADLMEVSPLFDPTGNTQRLAAYLLTAFLERQFAE